MQKLSPGKSVVVTLIVAALLLAEPVFSVQGERPWLLYGLGLLLLVWAGAQGIRILRARAGAAGPVDLTLHRLERGVGFIILIASVLLGVAALAAWAFLLYGATLSSVGGWLSFMTAFFCFAGILIFSVGSMWRWRPGRPQPADQPRRRPPPTGRFIIPMACALLGLACLRGGVLLFYRATLSSPPFWLGLTIDLFFLAGCVVLIVQYIHLWKHGGGAAMDPTNPPPAASPPAAGGAIEDPLHAPPPPPRFIAAISDGFLGLGAMAASAAIVYLGLTFSPPNWIIVGAGAACFAAAVILSLRDFLRWRRNSADPLPPRIEPPRPRS